MHRVPAVLLYVNRNQSVEHSPLGELCLFFSPAQAFMSHFLSAKFPHVSAGEQGKNSGESFYEDPGHLFLLLSLLLSHQIKVPLFSNTCKAEKPMKPKIHYKHLLSEQTYLASCRSVYTIDSLVSKQTIETKFSTYFGCMRYLVAKSYPAL